MERPKVRKKPPAQSSGLPQIDVSFVQLHGPGEGSGYTIDEEPVAATAASGHSAWGHHTLSVSDPAGEPTVYDFIDQVDPDLPGPEPDWGSLRGAKPEVVAGWDPAGLRPKDLTLVDLAWSRDGSRLAMLWTFLVTDHEGRERLKTWLGLLEPAQTGSPARP